MKWFLRFTILAIFFSFVRLNAQDTSRYRVVKDAPDRLSLFFLAIEPYKLDLYRANPSVSATVFVALNLTKTYWHLELRHALIDLKEFEATDKRSQYIKPFSGIQQSQYMDFGVEGCLLRDETFKVNKTIVVSELFLTKGPMTITREVKKRKTTLLRGGINYTENACLLYPYKYPDLVFRKNKELQTPATTDFYTRSHATMVYITSVYAGIQWSAITNFLVNTSYGRAAVGGHRNFYADVFFSPSVAFADLGFHGDTGRSG